MPAIAPRFDAELQMFVEAPHVVDQNHLDFQRWLVDHGRQHVAAGPPSGEYAGRVRPTADAGGRPAPAYSGKAP